MGLIPQAFADFVVSDGRFTNVYVFPNPNQETWEQHMNKLPANLKPSDPQNFTRQNIDAATEAMMSPNWPSYFGALYQYGGINPPRFFGSYVASQECVDAAMKDLNNGVLEWTTIRSLSNCHIDGMDPSPQVNLIFSPDIKIGNHSWPLANGPDICSENPQIAVAYHSWGLNTPNFAVLPTASGCAPNFTSFTANMSHEDVEMLSDPGQFAHGSFGGTELADQCKNQFVTWNGVTVQMYRSDNDEACWPFGVPGGSTTTTWVLDEKSPIIRFTGDTHEITLDVPARRTVTNVRATQVQLWIQTGGDDLRGGDDNADATLTFVGGSTVKANINHGREWGNGQTHIAIFDLPTPAPRVQDIQSVTITTHFGGGIGGDNWNMDKVALIVAFPTGSATIVPPAPIVHKWLDVSDGPLVRFTGDRHDLVEGVNAQDVGQQVRALDLIISTGNDDLRGGDKPGDNCDVIIALNNGGADITLTNVNGGDHWEGWTDHAVSIPIPAGGLRGGDVKSVQLHTGFGGGLSGDNWNVERLQLIATLNVPPAVTIKAPANNATVPFGALNSTTFEALAVDYEIATAARWSGPPTWMARSGSAGR
jgi:hypothetical protein